MRIKFLALFFLALAQVINANPSSLLSGEWKFIKQKEPVNSDTTGWESVTIPHTWNAVDAQNGGGKDMMSRDGYYRGPACYVKTFSLPSSLYGKRLFIRFEAVSSKAEVYLNGKLIGAHKGAFGAFAFDISKDVKFGQKNELRVFANNEWDETLIPLSGDFPIFGGIYRPVHLLVKNRVCISPLQRGSHGVFMRQDNVSLESATLVISALLDNDSQSIANVKVDFEISDATGNVVAASSKSVTVATNSSTATSTKLTLKKPHLWHGRIDPYLYNVKVSVSQNGKVIDQYTGRQGFRFFKIDGEKGFFLNGKPYQLWGINRHQCQENKGWALTKEDHDLDIDIIDEMGTRAIRLAHYPHSEYFFQKCDEKGILVTAELPIVDCVRDSKEFYNNTVFQMNEIIDMYGNMTSVFAYGIYNELYHRKSTDGTALLHAIQKLCKERDPSRYTYGGTNQGTRGGKRSEALNKGFDHLAFNGYAGWYGGGSAGMKGAIAYYQRIGGNRGIAISEYGAGASIKHHETVPRKPRPTGKWHPENYQSQHHEIQFEQMKKTPYVWGTFVWNMFDFCSVWRNEGDRPGINDKGLVSHDRKTKKDGFYFYKANWTKTPVLYITSRRHTLRGEKVTPIKVYSNVGKVTLTVNGKTIGTKAPSDMMIVSWDDIELVQGENSIVITAGKYQDSCKWTLSKDAKEKFRGTADNTIEGDDPALVFDGSLFSRWTTSKKGTMITKSFKNPVTAEIIAIAWYKGDSRTYKFKMQVSNDKKSWKTIFDGKSRQSAADLSRYEVPKSTFKHLRIICNGNNENNWSSIWEVQCPAN